MLVERVPIHLESLRYSEFTLWDLNFESFIKVSHISLCFRIVNRLPGNCLILYLFSVILRFQAFVCIYPYCIILPYSTILCSLFWTLIISKKLHMHIYLKCLQKNCFSSIISLVTWKITSLDHLEKSLWKKKGCCLKNCTIGPNWHLGIWSEMSKHRFFHLNSLIY